MLENTTEHTASRWLWRRSAAGSTQETSRWDLWKHRRSQGEEGTQNVLLHTWSHCVRDLHLVCLVMISETIWSPIIGHGLEIIFYRARPHILWRSPSQNLGMAYAHGKHDPKAVFLWKNGGCSVGDFWTFKSSGVAEMFGRQAPVHDHNLGRLHEALLGKGIKKKGGRGWKGVELVREAWFCMIQCVLYISPWWWNIRFASFRHENCILLEATCIQHKEQTWNFVPSSLGRWDDRYSDPYSIWLIFLICLKWRWRWYKDNSHPRISCLREELDDKTVRNSMNSETQWICPVFMKHSLTLSHFVEVDSGQAYRWNMMKFTGTFSGTFFLQSYLYYSSCSYSGFDRNQYFAWLVEDLFFLKRHIV